MPNSLVIHWVVVWTNRICFGIKNETVLCLMGPKKVHLNYESNLLNSTFQRGMVKIYITVKPKTLCSNFHANISKTNDHINTGSSTLSPESKN